MTLFHLENDFNANQDYLFIYFIENKYVIFTIKKIDQRIIVSITIYADLHDVITYLVLDMCR